MTRLSHQQRSFLLISQGYPPDPASVGQHMADAAGELTRRGHRVVVLTADRGYDNPSAVYARSEILDGVEVWRLPFSSFGKRSVLIRLLGAASFSLQAAVRGLCLRRVDAVVVSTFPPLAPLAALFISVLRRAPIKFWVMDLNPDQLIALGVIGGRSLTARIFDAINRLLLKRAVDVVVLDRYMAERVCAKHDVRAKLTVIPPWPLEDHLEPVPHAENPFRERHGLEGKFVIMYSGNHSPSNPITTVLEAAKNLADDPRVVFMFIGGGLGKKEVEAAASANVRSLPYEPLSQLRYSLSAADVHLVTIGDAMVGIVHPSKVYGAMAVARPVILLGPERCHISEILREHRIGWRVEHGDLEGAERVLRAISRARPNELTSMGNRARVAVTESFSKAALCGRLCDVLERGLRPRNVAEKGAAHQQRSLRGLPYPKGDPN